MDNQQQRGIIKAIKDILGNAKMWKRLIMTLLVAGIIAWLIFVPKDIPTPWGTCHQGTPSKSAVK